MSEILADGRVVLTKEEAEIVTENLSKDQSYPQQVEKPGIFQFLNKVLDIKDTSKVGNLDEKEELPSVRNLLEGALYCEIMGSHLVKKYFSDMAEIILKTSDSKKGFLIEAAITQKKDVKLGGKKKYGKTPWFKKNVESGGGGE